MLDADAKRVLDAMAAFGGAPLSSLSATEARLQFDSGWPLLQAEPQQVQLVSDLTIEGPGGEVAARLYRGVGAPAQKAPCCLYFHGGGWVLGGLDSHDRLCRLLANAAQAVVIAVDYRLAPEAPFPAAIEDAAAALRHVVFAADALGIDAGRVAVAGDSAGGNIAASVALLAKAGEVPPVGFQILIYPVADVAQDQDSYKRYAEGFGLTTDDMNWFRAQYLPNAADYTDPRAAPLRAKDVAGVAPAFIVTAGYDVLHDEARDYAERLRAAGVPTTLDENPGQIHGFFSMEGVIAEAEPAIGRAAAAWRAV